MKTIGGAIARLQVAEQVEDRRLHRHVERRHRLVAHDEVGIGRESARDADALLLAAAQLVRQAVEVTIVEPHREQQIDGGLPRGGAREPAEHLQRTAQRVTDRAARIERRVGILEHHLQAPSQLRGCARRQSLPEARRRTRCVPRVGSTRPTMQRASVVLPQPLSPTTASVSFGCKRQAHAVERVDDAFASRRARAACWSRRSSVARSSTSSNASAEASRCHRGVRREAAGGRLAGSSAAPAPVRARTGSGSRAAGRPRRVAAPRRDSARVRAGNAARSCTPCGTRVRSGIMPGINLQRTRLAAEVELGQAFEQAGGVRMQLAPEHRAHRTLLDHLPRVHHAEAVADPRDHAEVVADVENGRGEARLERVDQIEDLRLGRDVEARGRLVHDQQVGIARERHRDQDALLLASAQLVRIAPEDRGGLRHVHGAEQVQRASSAPCRAIPARARAPLPPPARRR